MDVQEHSPRTSSASEPAGSAQGNELSDQIPGGRYHIVERLSTGAIGAVYKGLDTILDRPVAVKCVRLDTPFADQGPDELRERFVREARIAARLQHPNIVTIHDIVATPDRGYIIMEFIEGRTLESLLESEGRLPLSTAVEILSQLSSALDYAHGLNVVHRDVKPSNILVSPSTYVWVTDFGIAKSELSTNLTMAGGVLGAPDYMSPEQAKGEDVDARSDLFSLGCILFESVVGEKPFRSPSLTGVLLSIINDEPVFPLNWRALGLPMELKPILHRALEKDPDKRFSSGKELMEALEGISKEAVAGADVAATRAKKELGSPETTDTGPPHDETPETGTLVVDSQNNDAKGRAQSAQKPEGHAAIEDDESAAEETGDDSVRMESADASAEESPSETGAAATPDVEPKADAPSDEEGAADGPVRTEAGSSPLDGSHEDTATASDGDSADVEPKVAAEATSDGETESQPADDHDSEADASPETVENAEPGDSGREREPAMVSAEQIQLLKEESQVLHLSPTLSGELQGVEISPEEGFLLSRIDGVSRPNDIISVSPLAEADTVRALLELLEKGLIRLGGVTREPAGVRASESNSPRPRPKPAGPDEGTIAEVDRLLGLAEREAYPELLGLPTDASEAKRKSAYLKIVARFHPDKFSGADEGFRDKLSTLCAAASEAVTEFQKHASTGQESSEPTFPSNGRPSFRGRGTEPKPFDASRHARELYDRALSAFDRADYWDAIQLGRQAIEADDQVGEFYGLLGRALLRNKKWRKEAADNFLKATQFEPDNVEYLGLLAAIYQSEGLNTRAKSVVEKARSLDPDFEVPSLDESEVTTE